MCVRARACVRICQLLRLSKKVAGMLVVSRDGLRSDLNACAQAQIVAAKNENESLKVRVFYLNSVFIAFHMYSFLSRK